MNAGEEWVLSVGAKMEQRCLSLQEWDRGCFKRVGGNGVLLQVGRYLKHSTIMATQSSPEKRRGLHTAGPAFTNRTDLTGKWRSGVVR